MFGISPMEGSVDCQEVFLIEKVILPSNVGWGVLFSDEGRSWKSCCCLAASVTIQCGWRQIPVQFLQFGNMYVIEILLANSLCPFCTSIETGSHIPRRFMWEWSTPNRLLPAQSVTISLRDLSVLWKSEIVEKAAEDLQCQYYDRIPSVCAQIYRFSRAPTWTRLIGIFIDSAEMRREIIFNE